MRFHWNQWDPILAQSCSLLAECHMEKGGIHSRWPVFSYTHLWGEAIGVNWVSPEYVIQNYM